MRSVMRSRSPVMPSARTAARTRAPPRRRARSPSSASRRASRRTRRTAIVRRPPRCAASASTSTVSASLTAGWRVQPRKPVERRGTRERLRQHEEVHGQEQRQRDAGNAMHDERPVAGMAARARVVARACVGAMASRRRQDRSPSSRGQRAHGVEPAAEQHQREAAPSTTSAARPRSPSHSSAIARKPSGAWIATATTKTRVERRPQRARVHARDDRVRRQAVAHRVDDRREMHDDAEREHGRRRALQHEAPRRVARIAVPAPTSRASRRARPRVTVALSARPARRAASVRRSTPSATGASGSARVHDWCVWHAWQPASPATARSRATPRAVAHVVDERPRAVQRRGAEVIGLPADDVARRVADAAADAFDRRVDRAARGRRRRDPREVVVARRRRLRTAPFAAAHLSKNGAMSTTRSRTIGR